MKREINTQIMGKRIYIQSYNSLSEFYDYICDTPVNKAFAGVSHLSKNASYDFAQTHSYDEAVDLLKNGWDDMAKELEQQLKAKTIRMQPVKQQRNVLSVQGYQPVVPLYLAGVPQNMVSKQMMPVKQKVVDIVKVFNYFSGVSTKEIQEESIKVMQVVKRLESQGVKCNIHIALGTEQKNRALAVKIKVKNASERLNVSKLAFPLVHPSMLRRLLFRYIEVCPDTTKTFVGGYGYPMWDSVMQRMFPDQVVLPAFWRVDVDKITTLEEINAAAK